MGIVQQTFNQFDIDFSKLSQKAENYILEYYLQLIKDLKSNKITDTKIPDGYGVYVIYFRPNDIKPKYIGYSSNLKTRIKNNLLNFVSHINNFLQRMVIIGFKSFD